MLLAESLPLTASLEVKLFWNLNDVYHNGPKFSDRQVWANSADPDQTAPLVCSGSTLFAILSVAFGCITLL